MPPSSSCALQPDEHKTLSWRGCCCRLRPSAAARAALLLTSQCRCCCSPSARQCHRSSLCTGIQGNTKIKSKSSRQIRQNEKPRYMINGSGMLSYHRCHRRQMMQIASVPHAPCSCNRTCRLSRPTNLNKQISSTIRKMSLKIKHVKTNLAHHCRRHNHSSRHSRDKTGSSLIRPDKKRHLPLPNTGPPEKGSSL